MTGKLLSIGECMVELMQAERDMLRKGLCRRHLQYGYYARLFSAGGLGG